MAADGREGRARRAIEPSLISYSAPTARAYQPDSRRAGRRGMAAHSSRRHPDRPGSVRGVRLVKPDDGGEPDNGYEIVSLTTDLDKYQFNAHIMAYVRSIAQRYSNLGQQYSQFWAVAKAVELTEEALNRAESLLKLGSGTVADVAEAQQRLEQFKLDLVTKTSDLIDSQQSLRGLLGVPNADPRAHRSGQPAHRGQSLARLEGEPRNHAGETARRCADESNGGKG